MEEQKFTDDELKEFRDLVEAAESRSQLLRIRSRMDMPKFIARVGKEKCDAMFQVLKAELGDVYAVAQR
jgi:hypothetical protein